MTPNGTTAHLIARSILAIAVAALAAGFIALSAPQLGRAAPACDKSWSAAADGQWTDPSSWTPTGVPSGSSNVCIAVSGTYVVTLAGSQSVASLQIGGASGTQMLRIEGRAPATAAYLIASSTIGIGPNAVVSLTSVGEANLAQLSSSTTITNAGTINTLPGAGGNRALSGHINNSGDVNIDFATQYVFGDFTFTNDGTVDLTAGMSVFNGTQFVNSSGSVNATGAGLLNVSEGAGYFRQVAGTVTGNAVQVDSGAGLDFTGSGAGTFKLVGQTSLSGSSVSGQNVIVEGRAPSNAAYAYYANGFTNGGTITLTSAGASNHAQLAPASAANVFNNTGVLNTLPGAGGSRALSGHINNTGDVNIDADTQYVFGDYTFTNAGTVDVTRQLSVFNEAQFVNASGSVNATGVGELNVGEGASYFEQRNGTTTGNPVQIDSNATLNFTGNGAGTFTFFNSGKLKGTSVAGQTVLIREGQAGGSSEARYLNGFTNGGTITLSSLSGSPTMQLVPDAAGAVLNNTGTINSQPGTGGHRALQGDINNTGTININVYTQPDFGTLTNAGLVSVAAGQTLAVVNSAVYTQTAAGTFKTAIASGSSFGKLAASQPITLAGTISAHTTYTPALGTTFTVVSFPSRTGTFTSSSFTGGTYYDVNHNAANVQLVVTQPPPDGDGDGVPDAADNCPAAANPDQADLDGDGAGNVCDTDDDGDGVLDVSDNCPTVANTSQADLDGDGAGNACDADDDGDGVADTTDNCAAVANSSQVDLDGDGAGDACDADDDGDGVVDTTDNCPRVANASQADTDGDGIGNACDPTPNGGDQDADGVPDATDNCPTAPNASQANLDGDGQGDACDADDDGDGVADTTDNCPRVANASQADTDGDGIGNACDSTPSGGDRDLDGVPDAIDNCPTSWNPNQADTNGDGIGDWCQPAVGVAWFAEVTEGDTGTTTLEFSILIWHPSSATQTVAYYTVEDTATAPEDFVAKRGTVTFAPGERLKTVSVVVKGDRISERRSDLLYLALDPAGTTLPITSERGLGLIKDDDQVSLTISNESITEGDSGNKTMTFDLRLSGPSSLALAIYCSPHDGTAVQGRDYSFSFSDVKFKPGQTRKSVEVTIHGDRNREAHEEFTVRCYIGDVFDANVRPFQVMGVGTIRNDD